MTGIPWEAMATWFLAQQTRQRPLKFSSHWPRLATILLTSRGVAKRVARTAALIGTTCGLDGRSLATQRAHVAHGAHGDEGAGTFGDLSEVFDVVVDAADCEHLVEELRLDESDDDDDASASCDDGADEATGDVATGIDGAHESEIAATEPAPPAPPPVTLGNCIETLAHVRTLDELRRELPDVSVNHRWEAMHSLRTHRLGKVRCVVGSSLRIDCGVHGSPCKLHIDIDADFEWAQCQLVKWAAHGLATTREEHGIAAAGIAAAWRARRAGDASA